MTGMRRTSIGLAAVLLAGCGSKAAERPTPPVILADAAARCLGVSTNPLCRTTRAGRGVTPSFPTPHRPWGIAYAFHCPQPADFYAVVGVVAMDGALPSTGIYRHGRVGRGYRMETQAAAEELASIPSIWRTILNIEMRTTCAWHVRVVEGTAQQVEGDEPQLPGPERPT